MANGSFRDRFFTPRVARVTTSPSAILAFGAGAAAGVLAVGLAPLAVPAALAGGLLAYGARVLAAVPRREREGSIDPFALNEPWRRATQEAIRARDRFVAAVESFKPGPLKDTMLGVADQVAGALQESWRIAEQGQLLADARKQINDREVRWELDQAYQAIGAGPPSETQSRTVAALQNQLDAAARMDGLVASTRDQLALLNARLDESVTQAVELSVSNRTSDATALGSNVDSIVTDLEALRHALEDLDRADGTNPGALPDPEEGPGLQTSPGS